MGTGRQWLLRSHLARRGIELSKKLKNGDFIIVEVDDKSEPWMLGRVLIEDRQNIGPYVATDHVEEKDNWMGRIEPGDSVIQVEKLEPIAPGSREFKFPNPNALSAEVMKMKTFAVFVEDIRVAASVQKKPPPPPLEDEGRPRRSTRASARLAGRWDDTYALHADDARTIAGMMNYEDDLIGSNSKLKATSNPTDAVDLDAQAHVYSDSGSDNSDED